MNRSIFDPLQIHPAIRETVAGYHADVIREVQAAIATNKVVIVGMTQNPFPRRARKALDTAAVPYKYLEYGNYFGGWKPRLALKIWSGWPTLPMIFVNGVLIGGATDLERIIQSGDLQKML